MSEEMIHWESVTDGRPFPAILLNVEQTQSNEHGHTFYEIVYVTDGFCLHTLNGESSLLLAGDIIGVRPGDVHAYRGRRNVNIYNFLFLPEALGELLAPVRELPGMADFFSGASARGWLFHGHLSLGDRERVLSIFREMIRERGERLPGWELRSRALLTEFLVLFSRIFSVRFPAAREGGAYVGYVAQAIELMEARYARELSIAEIAAEVGVSADHFTRQFSKVVGVGPLEYLRRYRFARAIELLRRQTPVGEVCRQTGFRHLSHFSREFKALFGITPSEYARQTRA